MPNIDLFYENVKEFKELNIENELLDYRKKEMNKYFRDWGYSEHCKVCNSSQIDRIEQLREEGYSYQNIKNILGLDMSVMSLSRHFRNHYPKRKEHRLKLEQIRLKEVIEIIEKYPFLGEYFKSKDSDEIKLFMEVKGFCTDKLSLCDLIHCRSVSNSIEIQRESDYDLGDLENNNNFLFLGSKFHEILSKKEKCLTCKNTILTERISILEKIISNSLLNIDINHDELLYIIKIIYNNDINKFIKKHLKNHL